MRHIDRVLWTRGRVHHVWHRHQVTAAEVEEVCFGKPMIRRTRDGRRLIYGQTDAGRYLLVVVVVTDRAQLRVITAREMTDKERRLYQRQGK